MATAGISSVSIAGSSHQKSRELWFTKCNSLGSTSKLKIQRKSSQVLNNQKLSVHAAYNDHRGGGGDFVAGFLVGGALFGTLAYVVAPQIRRSLLNEDEYGFRRAKRPIYYDEQLTYYDEALEKTRQTLNAKISQLNSAIDKVSSWLRGGNSTPPVPVESGPEEATM
ncbi:hypothetical protein NMG60_11029993 [Bertholletia excelsa]